MFLVSRGWKGVASCLGSRMGSLESLESLRDSVCARTRFRVESLGSVVCGLERKRKKKRGRKRVKERERDRAV
jgi:hypothetical protein